MKRSKTLGFIMIWVSGIAMYMLLAIFFWLEATAAPLGAVDPSEPITLGYVYDNHEDDFGSWKVAYMSIMATIQGMAAGHCTIDGEVDWSCQDTRANQLLEYVQSVTYEGQGDATRGDVVNEFFDTCIQAELDRDIYVHAATIIFVEAARRKYELSQ